MSIDSSAVKKLCRETDRRLWNAHHRREVGSLSEKPFSRLVFPAYANGKIRVSEQEARFAFVESVLESNFFYSVETPTSEKYRFSGEKRISAQTDFALHDEESTRILNVEFKKGTDFGNENGITVHKDVQKLLRESMPGMWFHLVESVDSKTLEKVLDRLSSEFSKGLRMSELSLDGECKVMLFHICVLRQGFSIHKKVNFSQYSNSHEDEFAFSYKVSRMQFQGSDKLNQWDIHQRNNGMQK